MHDTIILWILYGVFPAIVGFFILLGIIIILFSGIDWYYHSNQESKKEH